jgi:hypothetical protein
MKEAALVCLVATVVALLWLTVPPSFDARFKPAVQHPLHSVSWARAGFCNPRKCLNG